MEKPPLTLPAGVHVLQRGWLSSNNILLVDDTHSVMVDSGYVSHAPQTLALVKNILAERPLDLLLNTHLHSDHCGGNAILQQHYACETWVPAQELAAVRAWDEDQLSFRRTGQRCAPFLANAALLANTELHMTNCEWQVLAAPGHDPHSLVLFCPSERILISADALWENGFGAIFGELEGHGGFAEQAAVLDLMDSLQAQIVIPGHGAPFTNAGEAIQRARQKLDYFTTDPLRNTRHIVRVLIAFLLLDEGQLSLIELAQRFANSPVLIKAQDHLASPIVDLLRAAANELSRVGVLRIEGDRLVQRV